MTSGNRPVPEQGSWQVPGASAYQPPGEQAARTDGRGRSGVVALVVALTELVIIAAGCNQWVAKHTVHYTLDHQGFFGRAVGSSLEFAWRISPAAGDNRNGFHAHYSQLLTIGVFVALSALLAAVAVRGTVTFWRAFFGVWTGALAAACVARVVGGLVTKPVGGDRATSAVFVRLTSSTVFAGAVIGLIAALLAALVAVATRRTVNRPAVPVAQPEPAHVPETPQPFYGSAPRHEQPASPEQTDGRTMQIPRFDPAGGKQWKPPADGDSTQAMPTAPDDERRG